MEVKALQSQSIAISLFALKLTKIVTPGLVKAFCKEELQTSNMSYVMLKTYQDFALDHLI